MNNGRLIVVHPGHRLAEITGNSEHLRLRQATLLQPIIEQLKEMAPAVLHQHQYLPDAIRGGVVDTGLHQLDDVLVRAELLLQKGRGEKRQKRQKFEK